MLRKITFYTLQARVFGNVSPGLQDKLYVQMEHFGELHVSPHALLCGVTKAAWIDSEVLARQYRNALLPIFARRYGEGTLEIVIAAASAPDREEVREQLTADTRMIRARLAQGLMAPNQRPVMKVDNEN